MRWRQITKESLHADGDLKGTSKTLNVFHKILKDMKYLLLEHYLARFSSSLDICILLKVQWMSTEDRD